MAITPYPGAIPIGIGYHAPIAPDGLPSDVSPIRMYIAPMRTTLAKVWSLFTSGERRKAMVMLLLVILMAVAETAGVISIMPFLSVLGRPEIVQENAWLRAAYERFSFTSTRDFIVALGITSMVIVVASSLFKMVTLHLLARFVHMQRHSLSARLLSTYLHQPYEVRR